MELVDKLCEPGKTYKQITRYYNNNIIIVYIHALIFVSRFLEECGITSSVVNPESLMAPNSKLNSQQLYKLGLRFVEKYNLKLGESLSPSLSPPPTPPPLSLWYSLLTYYALIVSSLAYALYDGVHVGMFPHLFKRKSSASLHHMLHSKYVEVSYNNIIHAHLDLL